MNEKKRGMVEKGKQVMNRIGLFFFFGMLAIIVANPLFAKAAESNAPTRVINLVYDDSGSMIETDGQTVDTWCQAKYAMEVFAAMLSDKDTMNVYVMSDFNNSSNSPARLVLSGKDGDSTNVKKIHDMLTNAGNTPFASVRKAYSDLTKATADEKWLVVLTDGEFQGVDDIDGYFAKKADDIKVMFLGMGKKADGIKAHEEKDIYYIHAENNSEILKKITDICTRIFNSDRLDVDVSSTKFTFDVPMAELVVFAQGANVEITGLIDGSGKAIKSSTAPVTVKYSEKAAKNYSEFIIDKNLLGSIAAFKGDFSAGDYIIDVSGAETVEVYYKPNVEIAVYLKNAAGEEVTSIESLETGEYTIGFGLVRKNSNEVVAESKLLGNIKYSAKVVNNGTEHGQLYSSGDKIHLEEGDLHIEAMASYLDYNTVSTVLDYTIYKNKGIDFQITSNSQFTIGRDGISENPVVVKMTLDGKEFTQEEWDAIEVPRVSLGNRLEEENAGILSIFNFIRKFNTVDELRGEKTEEVGILHIYPVVDKVKGGTYVGSEYSVEAYEQNGKAVWSGNMSSQLQLKDDRSLIEREAGTVFRLAVSGGLFVLLLGYTPMFKKRFPKSMKGRPTITCRPIPLGRSTTTAGSFVKNRLSSLLPYVPETGKLTFVPRGTVGVPSMQLKSGGGSRLIIVNTATFAGLTTVLIDGGSVPAGTTKLLTKSPNMMIDVNTPTMRYSCIPRN